MSHSIFITATEAKSGKSAVSLGVMEMLIGKVNKVGFFRPIINVPKGSDQIDSDINLILQHFNLDMTYDEAYAYTAEEAAEFISSGKEEQLLVGVIEKYNALSERFDYILCEGTDFVTSTAAFEFDINGEIAKNLGSPVLLVANAHGKNPEDTIRSIELAIDSLVEKGCTTVGAVVNRCGGPALASELAQQAKDRAATKDLILSCIPDEPFLGKPTVREIADFLKAEVLHGEDQLNRHVSGYTVAAMELPNFLTRIESGSLIIVPGDRSDIIVGCMASISAGNQYGISGLLLTGGLKPEKPIWDLIRGMSHMVPVLSVAANTFPSATAANSVHSKIAPTDDTKIGRALALFEQNVDVDKLGDSLITTKSSAITPKMFEFDIMQKAKRIRKHIVLPEGEEDRILLAANTLLNRQVCDLTLLGNEQKIADRLSALGIDLDGAQIIDPATSPKLDAYVETYYELRKHKGITPEVARDVMQDVNFYGAMMVYKREADGMVSGSVHTTAATIRPALQIIKTKPGFSIVSSVFFMVLNKVLVYGDCAVNPNPTAEQLAEIALSSAETAESFGVDPIVALLSYSSGSSGTGEDVEKVRKAAALATERAKEMMPGLKLEGPLQYDAAVDAHVAATKMPDSQVAGKATVFVFPDLNTGNNTYKAVQRSAGAMAVGPILQGLKYPVNDLSRGALVEDIVNTVVITAIQAQKIKE